MAKNIELTYTEPQLAVFFGISKESRFVIVKKGRRFGATKGAANACIEWCIEGQKILWGDTISANVDRYFERYFEPELKKNKIDYSFNKQLKLLKIGAGFVDFRSADRPENWEGFGYDKIILNEAGIILKNKYLFTNAVLPMMMDSSDCQLFALGVPKGKILKSGEEHPFYTLSKNADNEQKGYMGFQFSSYDNPLLTKEDIDELAKEIARMNPSMERQEIYGEFVDGVSGTLWEPSMIRHIDSIRDYSRIVVGIDPSGSLTGDEVGIVSAGKIGNNFDVLNDLTGHYTPNQWATIAVNEYHRLKADAIVVERNYGGDMVKSTIRNIDRNVRIIEVTASRGKELRAEPIVQLYEDARVFHLKGLHLLENEMLTWIPGVGKSPNRIDAMVWAVTNLSAKMGVGIAG